MRAGNDKKNFEEFAFAWNSLSAIMFKSTRLIHSVGLFWWIA
jgi:hypothetical protein